MGIHEKLANIQARLKAPKSQWNPFGKYHYRSCEDILEAAKPLCADTKTVLLLTDEVVQIGERHYVKATATLLDVENPSETISVTAYAREEETKKGMDGSQITGASSSYARKYALNGLFCIDDNKDSDSTNKGDEKFDKSPSKPSQKPQNRPTQKTPPKLADDPKTQNELERVRVMTEVVNTAKAKGMDIATLNKGILKYQDQFGGKTKVADLSTEELGLLLDMINSAMVGGKNAD